MSAFGWQGGTVHQLAKVTGLDTSDIHDIHEHACPDYLGTDCSLGRMAYNTCSLEFNLKNNFPAKLGNKDFWRGVWEAAKFNHENNS